jgi:hypothetical protein
MEHPSVSLPLYFPYSLVFYQYYYPPFHRISPTKHQILFQVYLKPLVNLPNLGSPALYVKVKAVQELLAAANQNLPGHTSDV